MWYIEIVNWYKYVSIMFLLIVVVLHTCVRMERVLWWIFTQVIVVYVLVIVLDKNLVLSHKHEICFIYFFLFFPEVMHHYFFSDK